MKRLKNKYFKAKEKLDRLRDNITLKRYKILSEAYKTGKEIWGRKFTRVKLAFDMEIPITTVLRCLALDRANDKSWEKQREGKISAFKLRFPSVDVCSWHEGIVKRERGATKMGSI